MCGDISALLPNYPTFLDLQWLTAAASTGKKTGRGRWAPPLGPSPIDL